MALCLGLMAPICHASIQFLGGDDGPSSAKLSEFDYDEDKNCPIFGNGIKKPFTQQISFLSHENPNEKARLLTITFSISYEKSPWIAASGHLTFGDLLDDMVARLLKEYEPELPKKPKKSLTAGIAKALLERAPKGAVQERLFDEYEQTMRPANVELSVWEKERKKILNRIFSGEKALLDRTFMYQSPNGEAMWHFHFQHKFVVRSEEKVGQKRARVEETSFEEKTKYAKISKDKKIEKISSSSPDSNDFSDIQMTSSTFDNITRFTKYLDLRVDLGSWFENLKTIELQRKAKGTSRMHT